MEFSNLWLFRSMEVIQIQIVRAGLKRSYAWGVNANIKCILIPYYIEVKKN